MFKENKYTRWYFAIIENRLKVPIAGYKENHHIIPSCLGGLDTAENRVYLSAREHFICHMLLTKMHDSHKLKFALVCMCLRNEHHERYYPSARQYEYIKQCNSLASSERNRGRVGFWKGKKRDKSFCEAVSKSNKGRNKGRVYYNSQSNGHVIALKSEETVPDGYIRGNPNADTSEINNLRGSKYYYNEALETEKRFQTHPGDGWKLGRIFKFITNGIETKQIKITETLPDGWQFGRLMPWRNKHDDNSKSTS